MGNEVQRYEPGVATPAINGNRILGLNDVWNLAGDIASSQMMGPSATPAQVFALMMICESEGIHYIEALRRFDIIEGKPALKAAAMQAAFQAKGGLIEWVRYDDDAAEAIFSHPSTHPKPIKMKVDYESCLKRGLPNGKDGIKKNWRVHRAAMLRSRCITAGIRMVYPGIAVGIYSPEEIEDMHVGETAFEQIGRTIDISPQVQPKPVEAADVFVFGQRNSGGYDPRPYLDVAKGAASEANDQFIARCRALAVEGIKAPFGAAQIHIAVLKGSGDGVPGMKTGEQVVLITEKLYPSRRQWVRETVQSFISSQLAEAIKALESEPTTTQDQAENISQEPVGREPGSEG